MDTLYTVRCMEGDCDSIMIPDYKNDDKMILPNENKEVMPHKKNTSLHRKSYEYQNYENTYDNQFDYTFLDPIDNNFNVNEEFTDYIKGNNISFLVIYVVVFTLLMILFLTIKKNYF